MNKEKWKVVCLTVSHSGCMGKKRVMKVEVEVHAITGQMNMFTRLTVATPTWVKILVCLLGDQEVTQPQCLSAQNREELEFMRIWIDRKVSDVEDSRYEFLVIVYDPLQVLTPPCSCVFRPIL